MNYDEIVRIWNDIEDGEPDISTEQLMLRTASMAQVEEWEVTDALIASGEWKEKA